MQRKTHIAFGLLLFFLCYMLGLPLVYAFAAGFAAFLPDIDWMMDKLWFKRSPIKRLWRAVFKSSSMHRTILHNVWAMLFFVLVAGFISGWNVWLMIAVGIGYASHLILDALTVSGVYFLWPYGDERMFKKRRFFVHGPAVTGSIAESALFLVIMLANGLLFNLSLYHQLFVSALNHSWTDAAVLIAIGTTVVFSFVLLISRTISKIF